MTGRVLTLAAGTAILLVAVGVLLLTAGGERGSDADGLRLDPDDAALVADGERIYRDACASCHGVALEGQPDWQQRRADGRLPAPPHDPSGHTWHHPDDVLFALTKYGPAALVNDPAYLSDMPGFAEVLSDRDILAVLSYIKSTWPPEIRARHNALNARAAGG
ncbi:cytochrome c [Thalassobaculum sp. OXR-137]|uniref:c-type cytochrome n=1 Tax=Thalassobaculum sp. OXR-137 TaxID=3100173 RepID=UPI002AC8CF27|nr:cytochrome c [Thalassobaculum sp. OXR-137]WPZ32173.1 cytochrome c [Thalassobaculum sp. OXR-137]